MIENSMVGPPVSGFPGFKLKESAKDSREDGSGSFAKTLGDKLNPKTTSANSPTEKNPEKVRGKETEASPPQAVRPQKAESPGKERATTAREKAIRKFMDSFESEFGIPPQKIVEAMALLEPSQMNQPPEATAEAVVAELGLDEEETDEAQAMYAGLLLNLQAIDQANQPKIFVQNEASVVTGPQVQERFLLGQERKSTMNQTVERLNNKFWMTGQQPPTPGQAQVMGGNVDLSRVSMEDGALMGEELGAEMGSDAALAADIPMGAELPAGGLELPQRPAVAANGAIEAAGANAGQASGPAQDLQKLLQEMKQAAVDQKLATATPEAKNVAGMSNMSAPGKAAANANLMTEAATPGMGGALGMMAQVTGAQGGAGSNGASSQGFGAQSEKDSSSGGKSEGDLSSLGDLKGMGSTPVPLKMEDVAAALKTGTPAAFAAMTMTPDDNKANVQQIMNQAQYLIQRGGGEVKVEMSPEGLGQVQLKILLQDGKVNVQMATESSEAKKAIESSMSDLKASLAAHKLSVDHIKIDVVGGTNTDNQARNDANSNNGQQRESTRQFWNQFQESFGNRGQREGMFELPSLKGYRQATRPDPLQPLEAAQQKSVAPRSDGRGRGINLVA